jgi:hypothetical protein
MNKKLIVTVGLAAVVVLSLVLVSAAFAQGQTPPTLAPGYGPGMMGGRGGMMGGYGGLRGRQAGPMHDYMLNAFAEALDISRADLDARLANGETLYQIAAAQGPTQEQFFQLMTEARQKAIEQAVADGQLTQEQVNRMLSHKAGSMMNGNFEQCPFDNATLAPSN